MIDKQKRILYTNTKVTIVISIYSIETLLNIYCRVVEIQMCS